MNGVDGSVFEAELGDVIPVVHTSIGGTRIIGRLTAGTYLLSPMTLSSLKSPIWLLAHHLSSFVRLFVVRCFTLLE